MSLGSHRPASCPLPTGRITGVNALGMQSVELPLFDLPPRYFIDHIRLSFDTIANAVNLDDFTVTEDSAGDIPVAARIGAAGGFPAVPITMGQTTADKGGIIIPGQLVWTYRAVYCWLRLDAGTANCTVAAVWRPVPLGGTSCGGE